MTAKKLAEKEARKILLQLPKTNKKESFITVLPYKKTSTISTKAVELITNIKMVPEEKGSEIAQTRTRKIVLPARYKI